MRKDDSRPLPFLLTTSQCQLLAALEGTSSLRELASRIARDVSVVSRQLKQIASVAPVVEKRAGTWRLTALGRRVSQWTRDASLAQQRLLGKDAAIRIASTREFASRILAPGFSQLLGTRADTLSAGVHVITAEDGIERLLLDGEADLGFDCGRPVDPGVRHTRVLGEPFAVVAAPSLLRRHRIETASHLKRLPWLSYRRERAPLPELPVELADPILASNDLAVVREMALAGHGWAVLPRYCVRRELDEGKLQEVAGWSLPAAEFGVWWARGNARAGDWLPRAVRWLLGRKRHFE